MQFESNGIHHALSTVMVFQSTDYANFRMIYGNRQLNDVKIKRIIKEIESGVDLLQYYPIQVVENNKRLEIMDGQHRFYICKKLRKPVYYIVLKRAITLPDIAKVNSNVEKWKGKDFINCFSQLENENYKQLQQLMDQYAVPLTTAISMLQSGKVNDGSGTKNKFEAGKFEVAYYDQTVTILDYCKQFNFAGNFRRDFISAIIRIVNSNKIKLEDLIEKVNKDPAALTNQPGWKEYLNTLENIFNKGKSIRVVIY